MGKPDFRAEFGLTAEAEWSGPFSGDVAVTLSVMSDVASGHEDAKDDLIFLHVDGEEDGPQIGISLPLTIDQAHALVDQLLGAIEWFDDLE